jgi:hypothetical protein
MELKATVKKMNFNFNVQPKLVALTLQFPLDSITAKTLFNLSKVLKDDECPLDIAVKIPMEDKRVEFQTVLSAITISKGENVIVSLVFSTPVGVFFGQTLHILIDNAGSNNTFDISIKINEARQLEIPDKISENGLSLVSSKKEKLQQKTVSVT